MATSLFQREGEGRPSKDAPRRPRSPYTTSAFKVFISYSRKDEEFVRYLSTTLTESGRETWVDWQSIPPTAEFLKEIYSAIEAADAFVFVISPDSVGSEFCEKEIKHALLHGKKLVPVLCRALGDAAPPQEVAARQWVDFSGGRDFAAAAAELKKALDLDLRYVREHTAILTRAIEWEASGRSRSMLLRGENLQDAEEWLTQAFEGARDPKLTPLQTDFIIRSRVDGEGETTRRRRAVVVAAAITLSLLAAVLLLYRLLHVRGKVSTSRGLVGAAYKRLLNGDAETALALAEKAVETWPSEAAVEALRTAMTRAHGRAVLGPHEGGVRVVEFSPDGTRVVTAGDFSTPRVWDARTGDVVAVLRGHEGPVRCAGFSADGRLVVTGGEDATARVWDASGGRQVRQPLVHGGPVRAASFRPGSANVVLTSSDDGTVRRWDISPGAGSHVLHEYSKRVTAASFSHDGELVLTAGEGGGAHVWRPGEPARPLQTAGDVESAAFSRNGGFALTAGFDSGGGDETKLWNVKTGDALPLKGMTPRVTPASFNDDDTMVVTTGISGLDGIAYVYALNEATWQVERPQPVKQLVPPREGAPGASPVPQKVTGAAFIPNSNTVVTTYLNGDVRLWDIGGEGPAGSVLLSGHAGKVWTVAVSGDGSLLATGGEDGQARVWQTRVGGRAALSYYSETGGPPAFSPDGKSLARVSRDEKIEIREPATDYLKKTLPEAEVCVEAGLEGLAFSPDASLLAASCEDGAVSLWRVREGTRVEGFPETRAPEEDGGVYEKTLLAFSADGRWFLAGGNNLTRVWEVGSWRETPALRPREKSSSVELMRAVLTRDGRVILVTRDYGGGSGWEVAVAGPAGDRSVRVLPTDGSEITGVALSPDERLLVTASKGQTPSVWDLSDGRMVASLSGYEKISGSAFSPDGRRVVTTNGQVATVWDVRTGKSVLEFTVPGAGAEVASFSPDGTLIVTANGQENADGQEVYLWDATTGARLTALGNTGGPSPSAFFFGPEGSYIAVVSPWGSARVYPEESYASRERLLALSRVRSVRSLSEEEVGRYLR